MTIFFYVSLLFFLLFLNATPLNELLLEILILELVFYLLSLLKNWFHTIMILMLLEMMMLKNFFLCTYLSLSLFSPSMIFVFTTFMVIEASMGMSILTLLTRSHGNDFLLSF